MIALANDHAGIEFKKEIIALLEELKLPYTDLGVNSPESTDYPLWGYRAARLVASGECDRGIVVCGTGVGISLAANKVRGIRCVVCTDCYSAKLSREHNDANMIALGARVLGPDLAKMILRVWLETPFAGGERHTRRVHMIHRIEQGEEL
ncbi:MAG: ribose 5-phosphate isomerase B [Spirochaetaceae bacterium]|jgi:ribose 5-phosphate isomerase B|nr:ribose 5-phosphate isomerase B [Spirochaetaceae bacterium]